MNYRPEIDGLRAIAVLIVLIFHINHISKRPEDIEAFSDIYTENMQRMGSADC